MSREFSSGSSSGSSESFVILGIDPGVDTGLAVCSFGGAGDGPWGRVLDYEEISSVSSGIGEAAASKRIVGTLIDWVHFYGLEVVGQGGKLVLVSEDFVLRGAQKDRSLLAPVRMLGLILRGMDGMESVDERGRELTFRGRESVEAGGGSYGYKGFEVWNSVSGELISSMGFSVQQASQAKSHATDSRLRDWGLWVKGARHSRDAIRHAVVRWKTLRA